MDSQISIPESRVGKLLYVVWNMRQQRKINTSTRSFLKDLIIAQDVEIFDFNLKSELQHIEDHLLSVVRQRKIIDSEQVSEEENQSIKSAKTQSKLKQFRPKLEIKNSNFRLIEQRRSHLVSKTPRDSPDKLGHRMIFKLAVYPSMCNFAEI